MKINPNIGIPEGQGPDRVGNAGSAPANKSPQNPAQVTSDQTNLSSDALRLSDLSAKLANLPDVRQDRVAKLSQAIQNGSYSVTDQQIAVAMLRDFGTFGSSSQ